MSLLDSKKEPEMQDNLILRLRDILSITGLSPSTINRMEKDGTFPKRKKLGKRAVCWMRGDIEKWLSDLEAS